MHIALYISGDPAPFFLESLRDNILYIFYINALIGSIINMYDFCLSLEKKTCFHLTLSLMNLDFVLPSECHG